MPAVLVEAGFLNTEADNELFDQNFDEISQAIANAVLKTLGQDELQTQERYYRVQTGAFMRKEYAEDLLYQLLGQNFPAYILKDGNYYKVQVGAFRNLDNAVRMEEALRRQGYSTFITT